MVLKRISVIGLSIFLCAGCAQPGMPSGNVPTALPSPTRTITTTEDIETSEPTIIPTTTPFPTATPYPVIVIEPGAYPEEINPFTGLHLDDPDLVNQRRPLLVKISNAPPIVRPQSGISSADLLIEHYAEGGWTRFSALFWSTDVEHLGSVRSVRLIDIQLTQAFDSILVFSGGSNGVIDTIRESPIYPKSTLSPQFGVGSPVFERFPRDDLPFEHTLFSNTSRLWEWADDHSQNRAMDRDRGGFAFSSLVPEGGYPASTISVDYSRTSVRWQYDNINGQYLRWTDDVPHLDALTGEQLAFENVIILSAYHEVVELFPEKYFGEETSLYIELQGTGPLTLFRDGQGYEGYWIREGETDMFTFVDDDGNTLYLKPGKSFIQVIRSGFEPVKVQ